MMIRLQLRAMRYCYPESLSFTIRRLMYVCLCQAVTDRDIRAAAARGARDIDRLGETLRLGIRCGRCKETAQAIIAEHLAEEPTSGSGIWDPSADDVQAA